MSLCVHSRSDGRPVPVLSWSPTTWRKLEAMRDQIASDIGTSEPWYMEHMADQIGDAAIAVHCRKPLRIDEVNQMAPTEEVRARPGRA